MALTTYHKKRTFNKTPEPKGKNLISKGPLTFVVQKHNATRLHYDFRLELNGVLKSWAVPKGPSMNPNDKRLAVMVEDHPLDYANFEGTIPKGNYGAGTVMVWDNGVYSPYSAVKKEEAEKVLREQLKKGHITFVLLGKKLKGEFTLIKTKYSGSKNSWLLIKAHDEYSTQKDILKEDRSVLTNRTMGEITGENKKSADKPSVSAFNDLKSLKKTKMPHKIRPMLAKVADEPFDKKGWVFEIKWDGYRALAEIENGKVKLYSRNHIPYNQKFSKIADELKKLPKSAVLDGEIVVLDSKGKPSFQLLQDYPQSKGDLVYYVFDILYLDGKNLTKLPLIQRKEILKGYLKTNSSIRYGDYVEENGKAFFKVAVKEHLEGVMAKNRESQYLIGQRSHNWLKIKNQKRQEAVVGGFTKPNGGRKYFGALVLGVYKRGKLRYIGHTGGGFDEKNLGDIYNKLKVLVQEKCPFDIEPKTNTEVQWVKPRLICEVIFKEWTKDNIMRQPIFLGLRQDKSSKEVVKEESDKTVKENSMEVKIGKQNVTVTNLSKVFWPKEKYTKGDVIHYYSEMSEILLPYLKDRPQSLLRFPDGIKSEGFYQKDVSNLTANWLKKVKIHSESDNKFIEYLLIQDKASLIYAVNLGCIDFNPWNSRSHHLDNPDYLIIDLDPEKTSFENVVKIANTARDVLEGLDIKSFCKTSGKRGLHIYVPMGSKYSYEQVRQFANLLCLEIQKRVPSLVSLKRDPKDRQRKVYLDYLRNGRGQTAASVYSIRAYPGATVSTPLEWSEVNSRLDPSNFTIKTIFKRLDKKGDLFKGVLGKGVDIKSVIRKMEDKKY